MGICGTWLEVSCIDLLRLQVGGREEALLAGKQGGCKVGMDGRDASVLP